MAKTIPPQMVEAIDWLKRGRALITDPNVWCQGNWLLTPYGDHGDRIDIVDDPVGDLSKVVKVCSAGALLKIANTTDSRRMRDSCAYRFLNDTVEEITDGEDCVEGFNDSNEHKDVLAAWDLAIERAEKAAREHVEEEP